MRGAFQPPALKPEKPAAPSKLTPTHYGPSSFAMSVLEDGKTEYDIHLWVGGDGWRDGLDGGWGKSLNLKFQIPSHQRSYDMRLAIGVMMEKHREKIASVYGDVGAAAICRAMVEIADGKVYRRSCTAEEVMKGIME